MLAMAMTNRRADDAIAGVKMNGTEREGEDSISA